jgi:hypothetical protein
VIEAVDSDLESIALQRIYDSLVDSISLWNEVPG